MNVILGGTHGLGMEIAKQLQNHGQETFVVGRSYNEASHGAGLAVDLSKDIDVAHLCEALNNFTTASFYWIAGYGYVGNFAAQPSVLQMGQINFTNVLPIAQAAWQKLLARGDGQFVVISSTTGVKPRANEAVYSATKHAQVGFARSLGLEAEQLGTDVKVSLFMPGGMQTPFWDSNKPGSYEDFLDPAKVAERIIARVSDQRAPFYEEIIERGSL